jgi:hypothetical protein
MDALLQALLPVISPVLEALAGKYGTIAQVLMIMGISRACMKPIMVAAQEVIKITPSVKDDEFMSKLLESNLYKSICFVLDYALSIKLPQK